MTLLIVIALVAMLRLGAPLFAIIAASVMISFTIDGVDLTVIIIEIYRLAEMPVLLAIPLFTFAGYLLAESKAPQRLVRITNVFFGWMPGGLAAVALVICAVFTAFTGASGVTIVALGACYIPHLNKRAIRNATVLGWLVPRAASACCLPPRCRLSSMAWWRSNSTSARRYRSATYFWPASCPAC